MTRSISSRFELRGGVLHCEEVPLPEVAAAVGTPVYVYSAGDMRDHARELRAALAGLGDPLIAYAVKANPNAAVLATFAAEGLGADIVSGGELERALAAGMPAERIVFSGVGKTRAEMAQALDAGIFQFNVESGAEAEMLSRSRGGGGPRRAGRASGSIPMSSRAPTPRSRPARRRASSACRSATRWPNMRAAAASRAEAAGRRGAYRQPADVARRRSSRPLRAIGTLIGELRAAGHEISVADLGGGLGVPYDPSAAVPPSPADYAAMVRRVTDGWGVRLVFEPGRFLVANAGVLLTEVIRVKPGASRPFVIVDAAMNDLMRPTLYDAWHSIEAVKPSGERTVANVVGPVCETGDTFAVAREVDEVAAGRPGRVPHRRRLCRDHGQHLQQPAADAGGAGRRRALGGGAAAHRHRPADRGRRDPRMAQPALTAATR